MRDVEFIGAVTARRIPLASVGLSASVLFRFDPPDDDPIDLVRVLDGPVTLIRTATGTYRVEDLLRNGVPMSDSIQPFRHQVRTEGGVTVHLDSLFMFPPKWQFNVVIENAAPHAVSLAPDGAALFVDRGDGFERVEGPSRRRSAPYRRARPSRGSWSSRRSAPRMDACSRSSTGPDRGRFGSSSRCRTSSPRFLLRLPQTRGRRRPLPASALAGEPLVDAPIRERVRLHVAFASDVLEPHLLELLDQ